MYLQNRGFLAKQADAARSASILEEAAHAGADIISEAFPNPQSSFHNKKQVTLLSQRDVVHSITERGQHR